MKPPALPAVRLPKPSRELELAVMDLGAHWSRRHPVPRAVIAEAEAARAAYERAAAPASYAVIKRWLLPLSLAVEIAPDTNTIDELATALCESSRLPASVYCDETLHEARRTFEFWPGSAKLHKFLEPHARSLLARRDALRTVAASTPAREAPAPSREDGEVVPLFPPAGGALCVMPPRPPPTLRETTALRGRKLSRAETIAVFSAGATAEQVERARAALQRGRDRDKAGGR